LNRLRERAARHHRSIQGELMALLAAAVESPDTVPQQFSTQEVPPPRRSGTRRIEEIAAERRARRKKPIAQGPLAVDVIRAERDGR
jgi:plasmid stability protein